jgi:hypothetical protein
VTAKELGEMSAYARHPGSQYDGLTKRELFAAMAMQGLLSNHNVDLERDDIAAHAVMRADDLLAELAKEGSRG